MTLKVSRRRVLTILGGAALLPLLGGVARADVHRWQGIALGAQAQIVLDHRDGAALVAGAVKEIARLENIFSLYLPDSQLSRLNRDGVLADPAFEMVELLSICAGLYGRTGGAFDPSVQALWALYAGEISAGSQPSKDQIEHAREMVGWHHIRFSAGEISFDRPGVMLTLNGIAQGFIADKVAAYFRANGVHNVLVNTGEIAALGVAPDGAEWSVKLGDKIGRSIALRDGAIATSAPLGTVFDGAGRVGHIIDPRTGLAGGKWSQVSVITESAAIADGLSTAFCLMGRDEIEAAKGDAEVLLT